jgi:hypothetical protein
MELNVRKKKPGTAQGDAPDGSGVDAAKGMDSSQDVDAGQSSFPRFAHVEDPVITTTKGRPSEKRKKSGLHLKPSKPNKCSLCGSPNHTTSSCSAKLTPGPEPKENAFFCDMA